MAHDWVPFTDSFVSKKITLPRAISSSSSESCACTEDPCPGQERHENQNKRHQDNKSTFSWKPPCFFLFLFGSFDDGLSSPVNKEPYIHFTFILHVNPHFFAPGNLGCSPEQK